MSISLESFVSDALTMLLLGGLLAVPAGAVITARWTEGLIVLLPVTLTAMLAGYVLSISRFSDGMTIAIGMIFGVFTVWVVGGLGISGAGALAKRRARDYTAPHQLAQRCIHKGGRA